MQSKPDHALFDQWAPTYDRSIFQRFLFAPLHRAVLDVFGEVAPPPDDVLDVGCGTGRLLESAAQRWSGARLVGVDVSESMLAQARRKHDGDARFRFLPGDASALPLEPESIDAAFSTMSFHHWGDQASGSRDIARVMRPGGTFVLADFHVPMLFLLRPFANRSDHANFLDAREIRRLLEQAGFAVLTHRHSWRLHADIFVGRKQGADAGKRP
jgi:ubiquinone/menaquinone biosynthesis C-methylase UbiE